MVDADGYSRLLAFYRWLAAGHRGRPGVGGVAWRCLPGGLTAYRQSQMSGSLEWVSLSCLPVQFRLRCARHPPVLCSCLSGARDPGSG
jgi:hypothetical protein